MVEANWKLSFAKLYSRYRNLVLYGLIGMLSVSIDFILFGILTYFFTDYYLMANVISVNCGIVNSFLLNRHFNFKVKNKVVFRFVTFYVVGIIGLAVSSFLLYILVNIFLMEMLFAKFLTIVIVTVFQFLLNKYVTFRDNG